MVGVGVRPRRPVDRRRTDVWEPSSGCWSNSGMGSPTEFLTLSILEYPSDGAASSLSDVLETGELPPRYYLSATACRGILRRAVKRGKTLPPPLARALTAVADRELDFDLSGGLIPSTEEISHCLNAGGMGRQDFESETLISIFQDSEFGVREYPTAGSMRAGRVPEHQMVVHSLSADGFDASEDGTGRGTPIVPIAICTAHTQSNGSGFSDDVAHTLESGGAQAVAFAQNSRDEYDCMAGMARP